MTQELMKRVFALSEEMKGSGQSIFLAVVQRSKPPPPGGGNHSLGDRKL